MQQLRLLYAAENVLYLYLFRVKNDLTKDKTRVAFFVTNEHAVMCLEHIFRHKVFKMYCIIDIAR